MRPGQTEFQNHVDDETSLPAPLQISFAAICCQVSIGEACCPRGRSKTKNKPGQIRQKHRRPIELGICQHGSKVLHTPLAARRAVLADPWRQMLHCPALPLSMMRYDLRHGSICIITSCWIAVTLFAMELEL